MMGVQMAAARLFYDFASMTTSLPTTCLGALTATSIWMTSANR